MKTQTFNDGVLAVYSVGQSAGDGTMPRSVLLVKEKILRYDERTVGITRYWQGAQNNANISRLLRTPRRNNVSVQDVAIPNDGQQYRIRQVQYPKDVTPPCMDLSLERVDENYDLA